MGRLIGTTTQYAFLPNLTFTNSYGYDANSNRTSLTAPDGSTNSYQYDTLNRLSTLTSSLTGQFTFGYDALSRRTSLNRPNGVSTNYSYDSLSRLLSVLHQTSTNTLDGASYTYDSAGNRTAKTNQLNGITEQYTYDAIYQLLQTTQGTTTTESYTYDPVGNRLSSLTVPQYSYNSSNDLTSNSAATFSYDNNGNTVSKILSSGTTQYGWDFENRMSSAVLPGSGGTVSFKYDPFGRRIQKALTQGSTTTTTTYLYDGANDIEEVDQNGNLLARYAQSAGIDEPLAELRSGTASYYEQDGLGSVTSLSSSAGSLGNTYVYKSFGDLAASTGSTANPFQYTGRDYDSETGLRYYRARYYDSTTGRFINEDPIGFKGGIDLYTYVRNSPVERVDPLGLFGETPKLPSTPTGKAGCRFVGSIPASSRCKSCMYTCRGYGALVIFPQANEKPCPSIDPVSGLVNTSEIDSACRGGQDNKGDPKVPCPERQTAPQPRFKPLPIPVIGPILDTILDPIAGGLQDALNDIGKTIRNGPPTQPTPWGPMPVGPFPVPVIP